MRFLSNRSTSCSTSICAFVTLPLIEQSVLFPSLLLNSLIPVSKRFFLFRNPFRCFFPTLFFLFKNFYVLLLLSACVKINWSPLATPEEELVTSVDELCVSSGILSRFFSVGLCPSLEGNSADVMTKPAKYSVLKLNCSKIPHAFHSDGGTAYVWTNPLTDLFSLRTVVGFAAPWEFCANSTKTMYLTGKSFKTLTF